MRPATGARTTQARELGARDLDVLVQLLELRRDLRQLPHAQRFLPLVALELDRLQSAVVVELVLHGVARFLRIREAAAPCGGSSARSSRTTLYSMLRELLLVVEAVLLELRLPCLQLGDGFDEPRFAIEHLELELGIAEAHQRLVLRHHVAGLHEHLLDAPAFDGVQIDSVARHDARAQRNEVVKGAARHGADGELVALDAQMPFAVEQRREQRITRQCAKTAAPAALQYHRRHHRSGTGVSMLPRRGGMAAIMVMFCRAAPARARQ